MTEKINAISSLLNSMICERTIVAGKLYNCAQSDIRLKYDYTASFHSTPFAMGDEYAHFMDEAVEQLVNLSKEFDVMICYLGTDDYQRSSECRWFDEPRAYQFFFKVQCDNKKAYKAFVSEAYKVLEDMSYADGFYVHDMP